MNPREILWSLYLPLGMQLRTAYYETKGLLMKPAHSGRPREDRIG